MPLRLVSLFSGCGGGDLGFHGGFIYNHKRYKKLPFDCVYASDIDKDALRTFQQNIPVVEVSVGDISETPAKEIPDCEILIGGFPCQSFSTVNPTKDPFDQRGNLYKEMARIIKEKQPLVFVAENVKGLFTLHHGQIFKSVCNAFQSCGYTLSYKLMKAVDYGIPQRRERIIIVGVRNDIADNQPFEFPQPTVKTPVPLKVCIDELAIPQQKYYFSKKAVMGMKNAKPNMKRGLYQDLEQPCLTITSHLSKTSLNSRDPVLLVDPENELYRRFTPREAARIQSFPDTFVLPSREKLAYHQIGNAIPPVLFWHVANAVKEYLKQRLLNHPEIIPQDIVE